MKIDCKQKIIFVTNYPIDKRDAKRFGFEILHNAGFEITVWDVSEFFYYDIESINIDYNESDYVLNKKFSSLEEIKLELEKIEEQDVLIIAGTTIGIRSIRTFRLNKLLSNSKGHYTAITWGDHPIHVIRNEMVKPAPFLKRLLQFMSRIFRKNYIASVVWRELNNSPFFKWAIRVVNLIQPLEIVWLATREERIPRISIDRNTVIRFIHNLDYDIFFEMSKPSNYSSDQFSPVVILDSMGPLHPDFLVEARESEIDLFTYSKMITNFIRKFQLDTGKKIVVAAHPRSDLDISRRLYGEVEVFFHKTSELVSRSSAVISTDGSTAISFAVMWRKPLIILNSSLFDSQSKEFNKLFSCLLAATEIDLDSDYSIPKIIEIDNYLYEQYEHSYIKKPGTPNNLFWKVVVEDIKSGLRGL